MIEVKRQSLKHPFSESLLSYMVRQGLSGKDLAREVGVYGTTVSSWIDLGAIPSPENVVVLIRVLRLNNRQQESLLGVWAKGFEKNADNRHSIEARRARSLARRTPVDLLAPIGEWIESVARKRDVNFTELSKEFEVRRQTLRAWRLGEISVDAMGALLIKAQNICDEIEQERLREAISATIIDKFIVKPSIRRDRSRTLSQQEGFVFS